MEKELNKISLYQEGGAVNKTVNDVPLQELSAEVQQRIEAGEEPAQILASYLQEGIEPDQLNIAFEEAGYDPSKFADLLLGAEQIKVAQEQSMQAELPGQMPGNVAEGQSADPQQELLEQLDNVEIPQANVGFETTARGPIDRQPNQGYRPIYSTPYPKKDSLINAAYMLNDFVGEMENSFSDWEGKQARYKQKQLANKSYDVDFGDNDRANYAVTLEDLNKGVVKTRQEKAADLLKYSEFDFNPELNKFTGNLAFSELDLKAIPKNQRLQNSQTIADITSGIKEYGQDNVDMVTNALKNESGVYGKDVVLSYDDNGNPISKSLEGLTEAEKAVHRGRYRDLMTGNRGSERAPEWGDRYIYKGPTDAPLTTAAANQPSMFAVPNSSKSPVANQPSFKEWYAKNSTSPMLQGKSQNDLMLMYDNVEFRYGGAPLPKAQFNIPDWMYGNKQDVPVGPMGPTPLQQEQQNFQIPNSMGDFLQSALKTDYNRDTQAVKDSQLQQSVANPMQVNTPLTAADEPAAESAQPTVTRKRSVGNAIDQAETFIKDSPVMNAVGDISKGLVMGANLLTAFTDPTDQLDDQRSQTNADKIYAVTDKSNAQGNFSVNEGLQEQNNLVDYYGKYGREIYKAGGGFEPHMMFDPKTGKGYKANKPGDHERMSKMGFIHQDEMQTGGEIEVDNDTLAALIAAGADIEML